MIRVILFLLVVVAAASGLAWLADRPGTLVINWEGREIQTTVFHAIVLLGFILVLAVVVWSILRGVWTLPAGVGSFFNRRREKRGLEALSSGMVAIGSGDKSLATRYAVQARKSLPNEPLTHILRAQAAQLSGDRATARRIFEAMLAAPDTEPLGLRGLFLEAEREHETEAARQFAERALKLNPKVAWPVHALFDLQCKDRDWDGALETLSAARKHGHIDKGPADRKRAVLLTAQAQVQEDTDPEAAMKRAEEAHSLAPDLVPASAIAGRLLAARGNVQKATKVLQRAWRKGPHPDLATAYAFARTGDSPRDRLTRVEQLAALSPHSLESPIAIAEAAIEARDFETARGALEPLRDSGRLTQRVCTIMARIEGEDGGNAGAVREWLARAVNAPRDPVWIADGFIAEEWAPVSPVTGNLDAFAWRQPSEVAASRGEAILHDKIEELVALGAPASGVVAAAHAIDAEQNDMSSGSSDSSESATLMRGDADAASAPIVDITPHDATPGNAPTTEALQQVPSRVNGSAAPVDDDAETNRRKYDDARARAAARRAVTPDATLVTAPAQTAATAKRPAKTSAEASRPNAPAATGPSAANGRADTNTDGTRGAEEPQTSSGRAQAAAVQAAAAARSAAARSSGGVQRDTSGGERSRDAFIKTD